MNGTVIVVAIGLAILAICIARQPMAAPQPKAPIPEPLSLFDHLEPLTAGGKSQEAGPTINLTGVSSTMITYDKL
jgi:hypothetical protein